MAKGYWYINLDVVNPVSFLTYAEANLGFSRRHNLHILIHGGDFEQMEGIKRHRNLLVEMPSYQEALALHASDDYVKVAKHRQDSCVADVAAVEGYEGPQPCAAPPPEGTADFPNGYWMARVDITDPVRYEEYRHANQEAFAEYGGWFLVRGGRNQILEGHGRGRYVVVAFRDLATARACYFSLAYQRALAIRKTCSESDLLIIASHPGYVPPAD